VNIWLCNVEYPLALNNDSIAEFKQRTGRDLMGTCRKIRLANSRLISADASNEEYAAYMSDTIDKIDLSFMLYSVIKQKRPETTTNEIQDAMIHVGDRPNDLDSNDGRAESYFVVAVKLANLLCDHIGMGAPEKKSQADS
jgi:hypothetical protein